jgi:cysteine desulfurase
MRIYLDYNATTPIDKEVADAMQPYLTDYFGNPSSSHSYGAKTKTAVENARAQVAALLNCKASEIIFTSGGSESNNYAIKGYAYENENRGKHIITSNIEHPAVTEVCKYLKKKGFRISYIPVDEFGIIKIDLLEAAICPETILITVMHANNEIGTIQPISDISAIAKKYGIVFHTDAAQSLGKTETDVQKLGVDLLSVAAHKLYAPKGIGVLYIREGIVLEKLIHGADHEQNKRAGTENVLEIVGLGKACEIAKRDLAKVSAHMMRMRDRLHSTLEESIPDIKLNGHPQNRLPNTLNLSFRNVEANILLAEMELNDIAASAGAACHTDSVDVSPVLTALGVDQDFAMGTIRFSVGRHTTEAEIDSAAEIIKGIVNRLRPETILEAVSLNFSTKDIKLTRYTQGLGCACKLRPQELEKILKDLPVTQDPNALIDTQNSDDAAVYRINDTTALVQTVDFFTPIVDEPYHFGAIAAANSLSDIYAMGAKPLFALNIVGFPSNRLPMEVLRDILKGAADKAAEAGISILGGHTIDDPEPKYGMVVSGICSPDKIWANSGAKPGDALILTKPLGTGILTTALKRGLLPEDIKDQVIKSMSELNKKAAETISAFSVHACTDITGFGFIGHLSEVTTASGVDVEIISEDIPYFEKTAELAAAGVVPGGSANNLAHFSKHVIWKKAISETSKLMLCDAQTSGGLLVAVPQSEKDKVLVDLHNVGIIAAKHVGNCMGKGEGKIYVK